MAEAVAVKCRDDFGAVLRQLEAPLLLPAPSSPSLQPEEKLICQGLPSAREVMATVAAAIHRA